MRIALLTRAKFFLLIGLSLSALVLMLINVHLKGTNQQTQNEIARQSLYIQEGLRVQLLYQNALQRMAEVSSKSGDVAIGRLLTMQSVKSAVGAALINHASDQ
jgi:hypothetical protein